MKAELAYAKNEISTLENLLNEALAQFDTLKTNEVYSTDGVKPTSDEKQQDGHTQTDIDFGSFMTFDAVYKLLNAEIAPIKTELSSISIKHQARVMEALKDSKKSS